MADDQDDAMPQPEADSRVNAFWELAKRHARFDSAPGYFGPSTLGSIPPPAWAFGGSSEQADQLLELVLSGTKTATASALWDYEAEAEELPTVGTLSIVTDGEGTPRALLAIDEVAVVPFNEVDAEHARREGEGDLSLAHWRTVHQRFFTEYAAHDRGFAEDMPVVLERFSVLFWA